MINKEQAQLYLSKMLSKGGDFAEIFVERKFKSNYQMINGVMENGNSGVTYGVGLRIYLNDVSRYAYTNSNDESELLNIIDNLAASIGENPTTTPQQLEEVKYISNHPITKPVEEISLEEKTKLMKKANDAVIGYDEVIKKAIINYLDENRQITIFNSNGKMIKDNQTRTRLSITAVAMKDDKMQDGTESPGAHMGFEFYDQIDVVKLAHSAAKIAITMIDADDCPSGKMCVVIDNGFGGVIFHEACGHSLEATSVAKGLSEFSGKVDTQIASSIVTAIDDGTIPNAWGSNNIDDEGNFTKRNVLIENGILKQYLVDTLNGRIMDVEPNGVSRRQSYTYEPTSRMSNTFIDNGESTFEEIISKTKYGLYAKKLGGGSVNPITGEFNFVCQESYLIIDGKIDKPVKGATLVGKGSEVLMKIDMVGNNLLRSQGMCGSKSGSIPTDVGQPTIRVSEMTVGGNGGNN